MGWIAGAVAAVGAIGSSMSGKEQQKAQQRAARIAAEVGGTNERKQMELESQLDEYYNVLEQANRARGGLNYGAYSSVTDWNPDYVNENRIVIPTKPVAA